MAPWVCPGPTISAMQEDLKKGLEVERVDEELDEQDIVRKSQGGVAAERVEQGRESRPRNLRGATPEVRSESSSRTVQG